MSRYLDYGGAGRLIHLAPANGFPPEVYRPLVAALAPGYRAVGYRPRPLWPASQPDEVRSWRDLTSDMLADLERLSPEPVVGVGHSLGGIMTVYAALQRPERFRAVALLEPTFLPRRMLPLLWAARQLGQQHRVPLARGAARRRHHFPDHDAARAHYTGRGAFAQFTPEALDGYLEGGLRPTEGGELTLAWSRNWESRIFALVPMDVWDAVTKLKMPLFILRARSSNLLIDRSWRQLSHLLPSARLVEIDGSHMVPMEQPQLVAAALSSFLSSLDQPATNKQTVTSWSSESP
jgi:pimeloyl-ACP methyl ester carboxylesterase